MTQNTQSDESIKKIVTKFLAQYPFVDASDVVVSVDSGFVNLNGTVRDKEQQKEIEKFVKTIPGVKDCFSYVTVDPKNGLIGDANSELNMI